MKFRNLFTVKNGGFLTVSLLNYITWKIVLIKTGHFLSDIYNITTGRYGILKLYKQIFFYKKMGDSI